MEHIRLIEFLSEEANELLHQSQGLSPEQARANLDEAAELLALSAHLMKKHSKGMETNNLRSAA